LVDATVLSNDSTAAVQVGNEGSIVDLNVNPENGSLVELDLLGSGSSH